MLSTTTAYLPLKLAMMLVPVVSPAIMLVGCDEFERELKQQVTRERAAELVAEAAMIEADREARQQRLRVRQTHLVGEEANDAS